MFDEEQGIELVIQPGESPVSAHERLTVAAFFPVRKQELFFKNMLESSASDRKAPLLSRPIYGDLKLRDTVLLKRHFGILDIERRCIICVVTHQNYDLITNEETCRFAIEKIIPKIYKHAGKENFLCNNVIISSSRGACHMDICLYAYRPPIPFEDVWLPFVRVTNSYNRTLKLSYKLGFCNRASNNRIVFGDRAIPLSSIHKNVEQKIDKQIHEKFSDIESFECDFYQRLLLLSKYFFPKKKMLELYCKAFGITENRVAGGDLKAEHWHDVVVSLLAWTHEYFERNGDSAYAAFCVLAAFASHPVSYFSPEMEMDSFQTRVGAWALEFSCEVGKQTFNLETYISEPQKEAASAMAHDYELIERRRGDEPDKLFLRPLKMK